MPAPIRPSPRTRAVWETLKPSAGSVLIVAQRICRCDGRLVGSQQVPLGPDSEGSCHQDCSSLCVSEGILGPYCAGALIPSGNQARVRAPQAEHRQSWARCSVTTSEAGSGRSNTPAPIPKTHYAIWAVTAAWRIPTS
jgi:hypothetical protein